MSSTWFQKYGWGILLLNLVVILWGAYVRATGSGAGCGNHWPLCNGEIIPRSPSMETLVEYIHRISSGLVFLSVFVLFYLARRIYTKGHLTQWAALFSLIFVVTESMIGAGLVIFGWVADNSSIARAFVVSIHLVNTFLLIASVTLTSWWASEDEPLLSKAFNAHSLLIGIGMFGVVLLSTTGAITALGDTLFPSRTIIEGIQMDLDPTSHFLIRLRVWHPVIALFCGLYILIVIGTIGFTHPDLRFKRISRIIIFLFLIQLAVGIINLILMAPIPLQLIHLLLADFVWIALVIMFAISLEKKTA